MVPWGGLRPILSQLLIDIVTIVGLSYASLTSASTKRNIVILVSSCLLIVVFSGPTNRWTLTLPIIPILLLQLTRRILLLSSGSYRKALENIILTLSLLLIFLGIVLSILFPAVQLPRIKGRYNVGVVDFFMPVEVTEKNAPQTCNSYTHLSVRLVYPTNDKPSTIPYLNPETALEHCRASMQFGAPPALKQYSWMLHTWRLAGIQAKKNASLPGGNDVFPLVVFSHGLGGNADAYSYQTMSLAAHGHIVLIINHYDGSASVARTVDGTVVGFDFDLTKLWQEGKKIDYVRARRAKTDHRVDELVAATEAMIRLDKYDLMELERIGLSFKGRLDIDHVFFMGHSFGGATALAAAKRRPDLIKAVIAHEPAIDWLPDDTRKSIFDEERIRGLQHDFDGGMGSFEKQDHELDLSTSVHEVDLLILFSHEWHEKKWGYCHLIQEMQTEKRLGPANGLTDVEVITDAYHSDFSDTCMLMPLWLARIVGITGKRNPQDTAQEIHERTRSFIESVRRRSSS